MIIIKKQIFEILLDDEFDALTEYSWWIIQKKNKFYAVHSQREGHKTHKVYMHRLIMNVLDKPKIQIDHKDGNGLNNQLHNLRFATRSQNMANAAKRVTSLDSVYKGVDQRRGKWRARLGETHLGDFDSAIEAATAYDEAALKKYGEYARTNF